MDTLKKYQEYIINQVIEAKESEGGNTYEYVSKADSKNIGKSKNIYVPSISKKVKFTGNGQAVIYQCGLYNEDYELSENFEPNSIIRCIVRIDIKKIANSPILGLAIRDRLGNEIVGINSQTLNIELPKAEGKVEYEVEFKLPELNCGSYTVTIAIANGYQEDHIQMCWADDALIFHVLKREHEIPGLLYIQNGNIKMYRITE